MSAHFAAKPSRRPTWSLTSAIGAAFLAFSGGAAAQTPPVDSPIFDLPNPPELRSADGVLRGTLTFAPAEVTIDGQTVVSNVINGNYMAPTLRIRRGDTIRVKAVNGIGPAEVDIDAPQPTNIHYHGMDVAPKRHDGDNVFIRIKPGQELRYDVFVPDDHPQGLHWYHAHVHTFVDDQIGSGISGMLIVGGFIFEQYPELFGQRQRVMVLKDFTFPGFIDGDARAKSLNGYANPPIRARPGEWQIWQLGNLGADAFFDMQLDGHELWLIERDGNLLLKPVQIDHLFLPPGARAVVVVQAGAAGEYALRHLDVDTGPAGDPNPPSNWALSSSRVNQCRSTRRSVSVSSRVRRARAGSCRARRRWPILSPIGRDTSTFRKAPTETRSSSITESIRKTGSTRLAASARSSGGSCAISRRSSTSSTCTRPSS